MLRDIQINPILALIVIGAFSTGIGMLIVQTAQIAGSFAGQYSSPTIDTVALHAHNATAHHKK